MRIVILMYHMISETGHRPEKRYALSPNKFKMQMRYLKDKGFTPVTLDVLHNYFMNKTVDLPRKPILITFDDGYRDNYENAFPVLREFNFPATVFIVGGFVGKINAWDIKNGFREKPLMGWREIEEMQGYGITIGSHTMSHPRLSRLSLDKAKREIGDSKKLLEDRLGMQVDHFAYPHGDRNESVIDIVKKAGYKAACSTKSGFNFEDINLFELRRIEVYGTDSLLNFAIKLQYGTNNGNLLLPARYYAKRIYERITNNLNNLLI